MIILYYIILYCVILYYIILYYIALYYTILYGKIGKMVKPVGAQKTVKMLKPPGPKIDPNGKDGKANNCAKWQAGMNPKGRSQGLRFHAYRFSSPTGYAILQISPF